jgi:hypothetical protein
MSLGIHWVTDVPLLAELRSGKSSSGASRYGRYPIGFTARPFTIVMK